MAWRPHGRARVNPNSPRAFGVDDRSGFLHNLNDLVWQTGWVGNRLVNLRILVSRRNLDKPNEQLRARILPPDPVSVPNSRPESYASEDLGESATQSATPPNPSLQIWDE